VPFFTETMLQCLKVYKNNISKKIFSYDYIKTKSKVLPLYMIKPVGCWGLFLFAGQVVHDDRTSTHL
jgi:hypothetical protein